LGSWFGALSLVLASAVACSSSEGSSEGGGDDDDSAGTGNAPGTAGSGNGVAGADQGTAGSNGSATAGTSSGTSGTGSGSGGTSSGSGGTSSGTAGSGSGVGGSYVVIPGGGEDDAPLGMGCGPETADECYPTGEECSGSQTLDYAVIQPAAQICFYGDGMEIPSATVEHVVESFDGQEYVHLRVTFDPDFVDTVYGDCSPETGWNPNRPHTFRDLYKSDHVELMLYDCSDSLAMHFSVDLIDEDPDSPTGYASLGVLGGDGGMVVGDAEDILEVTTSLDRNLNACGYQTPGEVPLNSPCPGGDGYEPNPDFPNWDFRHIYELWIDADAFGSAGYCTTDIDYVHASPAKTSSDTILVEPDECPDTPWYGSGGTSGTGGSPGTGGSAGTPGAGGSAGSPGVGGSAGSTGDCPPGYVPDLISEGAFCVPE
jgi:hypothetical protein